MRNNNKPVATEDCCNLISSVFFLFAIRFCHRLCTSIKWVSFLFSSINTQQYIDIRYNCSIVWFDMHIAVLTRNSILSRQRVAVSYIHTSTRTPNKRTQQWFTVSQCTHNVSSTCWITAGQMTINFGWSGDENNIRCYWSLLRGATRTNQTNTNRSLRIHYRWIKACVTVRNSHWLARVRDNRHVNAARCVPQAHRQTDGQQYKHLWLWSLWTFSLHYFLECRRFINILSTQSRMMHCARFTTDWPTTERNHVRMRFISHSVSSQTILLILET